MRTLCLGLGVFVLLVCAASAADFYVATTGLDTNPGTLAQPFRTTQRGFQALNPGDTLFLRAGTWGQIRSDGTGAHTIRNGTSVANAPRIVAYPGDPAGSVIVRGIHMRNKRYLIWDGLKLDAGKTLNEVVYFDDGSDNIIVQNCEVTGSSGQGILLTSSDGGSHRFTNLDIHHNGDTDRFDHGVYWSSPNNILEYSRIHHNWGYGIQIYHNSGSSGTPAPAHNNLVQYNEFFLNSVGPTVEGGVVLGSGNGSKLLGNRIYNNPGVGVQISYDALNQEVRNNTIYNNTGYGVDVLVSSTGALVRDNLVSGNGFSPQVRNNGVSSTIANNPTTGDICVPAP